MQESTAKKLSEAKKIYYRIDEFLFDYDDLSNNSRVLYAYLKFRQGKNENAWPRIETIARDIRVSERTVDKCVQQLIDARLLLIRRCHGGVGQSHEYKILGASRPQKLPEKVKSRPQKLRASRPQKLPTRSNPTIYIKKNISKQTTVVCKKSPDFKTEKSMRDIADRLHRVSQDKGKGWDRDVLAQVADRWRSRWDESTIVGVIEKWGGNANSPGLMEHYLKKEPTIEQLKARRIAQRKIDQAERQRIEAERAKSVGVSQGIDAHKEKLDRYWKAPKKSTPKMGYC